MRRASEEQLRQLTHLANQVEEQQAAELAELAGTPRDITEARRKKHAENKVEAVALRMAGLSIEQIAVRLDLSHEHTKILVSDAIKSPLKTSVEELRELENARLDRAQAAIWSKVLEGDLKAIDLFLRISARRSQLNGMNEPMKIDLAVSVKAEMETALAELQNVVLGEVISSDDHG